MNNFYYLYPLQSLSIFNTEAYDDNISAKIVGIVLVLGIAAIIIFLNVSKTIKKSKVFNTGVIDVKKLTPQEEAFHKLAEEYQLEKAEVKFLGDILRGGRSEPAEILGDENLLDEILKSYYQSRVREMASSKIATNDLVKLFKIRNVIAYFHSQNVPNNQVLRRQIRKESKFQGEATLVEETKVREKGKTIKKFTLTQKKLAATVIDISAGGCAFESGVNVKAGSKLKIDFVVGRDQKVAMLGEIMRINKTSQNTIYHVRSLKVMPHSYCTMNAYIFGYS
jgi:hypothetical protein